MCRIGPGRSRQLRSRLPLNLLLCLNKHCSPQRRNPYDFATSFMKLTFVVFSEMSWQLFKKQQLFFNFIFISKYYRYLHICKLWESRRNCVGTVSKIWTVTFGFTYWLLRIALVLEKQHRQNSSKVSLQQLVFAYMHLWDKIQGNSFIANRYPLKRWHTMNPLLIKPGFIVYDWKRSLLFNLASFQRGCQF